MITKENLSKKALKKNPDNKEKVHNFLKTFEPVTTSSHKTTILLKSIIRRG